MATSSAPSQAGPVKSGGFGGWLTRTLGALPYLVSGIEQIHAGASGETKKQLAMESLGLAFQVTGAIDPALDPALLAAAKLISVSIDGVKEVYNAVKNKPAISDPAAAAPAALAPAAPASNLP